MSKIVGTQTCGYLVYGFSKFCGGTQNFKFVCTKICGYSKFVGTCTKNLNFVGTQICGYSKFVDAQNLFIPKICRTKVGGYSKKSWVLKLVGIHTQKLLILKIWDTIICGYSKFVGIQNL